MKRVDLMPRVPTKKFLDEFLEEMADVAFEKDIWPMPNLCAIGLLPDGRCSQLGGLRYDHDDFARILAETPEEVSQFPREESVTVKWLLLIAQTPHPHNLLAAGISHSKIVARQRHYLKGNGIVLFGKDEDVKEDIVESMRPIQKALFERFP